MKIFNILIQSIVIVINKAEEVTKKLLPYDKCLHVIVGFYLAIIFFTIFRKYGIHDYWTYAPVLTFAVLKELYDKYHKMSKFDPLDIGFTVAPTVIILLLAENF